MSTLTRAFAPLFVVVALAIPAAASAGGSKPKPSGTCVQYNPVTHATKCFAKGASVTPVAHPTPTPVVPPGGGGVTPPTGGGGGGENPVPTPVIPTGATAEGFCVQTDNGETFIQAYVGAFDTNGAWRALLIAGATVTLDGHARTLKFEDGQNGREKGIGDGVIVAPNVPGVGITCGQPFVSTNGEVQNADWLIGLEEIDA